MSLKFSHSMLLALLFCTAPLLAVAQQAGEELPAPSSREIKVGSHMLRQEGDAAYCYDNGPYQYQKIWEVPNTDKATLYNKTLQWLRNVSGAAVYDIAEDETMNSLGASFRMDIPDRALDQQQVSWRFVFSFKDNKLRLKAEGFSYYYFYDRGMRTRQVAVSGGGFRSEPYHDAGELRADFHKLQPLTKGNMRRIYEDFDARYLAIIRSLKSTVISGTADNW